MSFVEPNIKADKYIAEYECSILIEDYPTMNFNTGKLDNSSHLHYTAKLYKRLDGSKYYIFEPYTDCTLRIMNCNGDIYDIIAKEILLNDSIEIWQPFDNGTYQLIPNSYRHIPGIGGMAIINCP